MRYVWLNRATNKVEPKVSYVRKVGQYVVGVGYSALRDGRRRARGCSSARSNPPVPRVLRGCECASTIVVASSSRTISTCS